MLPTGSPNIKNRNQLKIQHTDNLGGINSENFNLNLTAEQIQDTVTATAVYNWAIGYCGLTYDTYKDCEITITKDVDSLAGGE